MIESTLETVVGERFDLFRCIAERSPYGILLADPGGRIVYANQACADMHSWASDDLPGHELTVLADPSESSCLLCLEALLESEDRMPATPARHMRRDGERFPVLVSGSVLRDMASRPLALVFHVLDMTEREELEARLRRHQKMDSVGLLAGGIAHDFNNIIQVMLGNCTLALKRGGPLLSCRDELLEIHEAALRAADLTRRLLTFSRAQPLKLEIVDLNERLASMLRMLRRAIGELHAIEFKPTDRPVWARVDIGQIEQVLVNLCVNARDAMPRGGTIRVETGYCAIGVVEALADPDLRPGRYARFAVSDEGVGLDPSVLNRLFEPFFTTKDVGQGTGLGLATAYSIVKEHKGVIQPGNLPAGGATFTVLLPASHQAEARSEDASEPERRGSETILVAEDDETVREMIKRTLAFAGYRVLSAADGAEALERFDQEGDRIDMAILDVVMPKTDAQDLYERLRNRYARLPILVSSGYHHVSSSEWETRGCNTRFLRKPFRSKELLVMVGEMLDTAARRV